LPDSLYEKRAFVFRQLDFLLSFDSYCKNEKPQLNIAYKKIPFFNMGVKITFLFK
jgi:hypothetical protein